MPWKLKADLKKRPPDGTWKCEVDGWVFEGDSPEEVAEKVKSYNTRHNRTTGGEYQMVVDYNCELYPFLGRKTDDPFAESIQSYEIPEELWSNLKVFIDSREPIGKAVDCSIREAICRKCKFNEPFNPGEDNDNARTYKKLAMKLTNGRYSRNPELGICTLHKHDNSIAVWSVKQSSEQKEEQPENCWVK